MARSLGHVCLDALIRSVEMLRRLVILFFAVWSIACGDDGVAISGDPPGTGGSGAMETTSTSGDDSTTGEAESGGDDTIGSGSGGGGCNTNFPVDGPYVPVRENDGEIVQGLARVFDGEVEVVNEWLDACPDTAEALEGSIFNTDGFFVYRPGDASTMDGWPEAALGAILFSNANGGGIVTDDEHTYPVLEDLAAEGFVVVGVQGGSTVDQRTSMLRCAAEWVTTVWEEHDRITPCALGAGGHSQGGGGAHNLALYDDPALAGLKAIAGIAPASLAAGGGGSVPATSPVPAESGIPYLVMQGTNDGDTDNHGITNYDRMVPEDTEPVPGSDKVMLLAYNTPHWAWGGRPYDDTIGLLGHTQATVDRGRAIVSAYLPLYFRWKVYDGTAERRWFVDPSHYQSDAEAFPDAIAGPSVLEDFWSGFYEDPRYDVLGERPMILSMFSQGTDGGGARLVVDTLYREDAPETCEDSGHLAELHAVARNRREGA